MTGMRKSCERNGPVCQENDIFPMFRKRSWAEREGQGDKGNSHRVPVTPEGVQLFHSRTLSPTKGRRSENRIIAGSPNHDQLQGVPFKYKRNQYSTKVPTGRGTKRIYYTRKLPLYRAHFLHWKEGLGRITTSNAQ